MVALDEQFHHDDTMAQSGWRACGQFAQKPVHRTIAGFLSGRRRHGVQPAYGRRLGPVMAVGIRNLVMGKRTLNAAAQLAGQLVIGWSWLSIAKPYDVRASTRLRTIQGRAPLAAYR